MRISGLSYPDVNNGLGCRLTIWVQGCSHHCKGCHNRSTWDFNGGTILDGDILNEIDNVLKKPYIKGVTFSGGDPMDSFEDVLNLCKDIKENYPQKDIWVYTGYKKEELESDERKEIFNYIDYLVDGEFEEDKVDVSLPFRGSSNQIIWNIKNGKIFKSNLS